MEVKIYGLYDPTDINENIRYVGKTIQSLKKRLQGHIDESIKNNPSTYKKNWINSLLSRNIRPKIKLLEICEESNWEQRERYWISNISNLTNLTLGGECPDVIKTPIIRYSIDGVKEHYYEKIEDAARDLNISRGIINSALQRNPKGGFGGGFLWRYVSEGDTPFIEPYISSKNSIVMIIDLQTKERKLFFSLKEGLEYFNIKRVGNINRCIDNKIPYKNRYFIKLIN